MVGNEDGSTSWGEYQPSSTGSPKKFFRSSSWSVSRTSPDNPDIEVRNRIDQSGNPGNNSKQPSKFPGLLTPRGRNSKGRSCFPPLQPLAISRRSLDEWPRPGSDDVGVWHGPPTPGGRDANKGGERLKLDLSTIQSNAEKGIGLLKRDKIACFDTKCSKVAEHIYLGGDVVARDREILKRNGITHVLNCVGFVCQEYFKADFVYRTLWLQDKPSEDITSILYDVFDYFEDVREQKGKVFVHCCQGVSRSTSLVIAYRMWREGQSFDDAFQFVKDARGIADPNMGFACQLLQCQKRVHAVPLSPSSLLRVYRMAPHSPYDPLHLVPKMLDNPSPQGLDTRGAFIIHVPSTIYIWIGKRCEFIMERDARGAVCQILCYERVHVPVHLVEEGNEPSLFWDAFSDFVIDKSADEEKGVESLPANQAGEMTVKSYDVDFEIFQKAIVGGFVPALPSLEAEHETCLPARESSWSMLRRKYASGHMKEFVSAPKLHIKKLQSTFPLSNVRADRAVKHMDSSAVLLSTTASTVSPSSSSSPPYLSPDSISSDSSGSSNALSDSPLDSPSAFSSTLSTLSNLSLTRSNRPGDVTNHPGYIEVNFASQAPISTSSGLKRSHLSIAERRGSMSKCLKLPATGECMRTKDASQNYLANQQDDSCIVFELGKRKVVSDSWDSNRNGDGDSRDFVVSTACRASSGSEPSLSRDCQKFGARLLPNLPSDSNGLLGSAVSDCSQNRPLVYCLSSMERITKSASCSLDTKSAYVIVAPEAVSGLSWERNMYLWIGSSFTFSRHHDTTNNSGKVEVANGDSIDWNRVGSDVALHLGLPSETNMKVVTEGKEPEDFLLVLSML